MNKIILSVSMLGPGLHESLENNLTFLCEEFGFKLEDIVSALVKISDRAEINNYLTDKFPNQIKIVD